MPIFSCHHCGQPIEADDSQAGEEANCPVCQGAFIVPGVKRVHAPRAYQAPELGTSFVEPEGSKLSLHQMVPPPLPPSRKGFPWHIFLTTFIAFYLAAQHGFDGNFSMENAWSGRGFVRYLAEATGRFLGAFVAGLLLAFPVAAIWTAIKGRFWRNLAKSYSICIIFVSLLGLAGGWLMDKYARNSAASIEKQEAAKDVLGQMQEDMRSAWTTLRDSNGKGQAPSLDRSPSTASTGSEYEQIRALMQAFYQDLITLQNEYVQELNAAGINELLKPDRISTDRDFIESQRMLGTIREVVQRYKKRAEDEMARFPERINNASFSSSIKDSMLSGFQRGQANASTKFREVWKLEISIVERAAEMLGHLRNTKGLWTVQNGMFIFDRNADLNKFNQIMQQMNDDLNRQTELRDQSQRESEAVFENLDIPKS